MKASHSQNLSRRSFIKKSSFGIGGIILAPTVLPSYVKWRGANDRIQIGHIGVGSRGTNELKSYFLPLDGSRSVAICDVFRDRREKGVELVKSYYSNKGIKAPECTPYLDFEEVLMP